MTGLIAVPVHNEVSNLPRVIDGLLARFPVDRLLFIDDGSTDGSHRLLAAAGVRYLRHPINLGYHEGLKTAMREVLLGDYAYVAFFDGDGQHRVEDLERIVARFEAEPYDLIIGSRYRAAPAALSARSLGTRSFSWLTRFLSGADVTDVTNGLKLISRRYLPIALRLPAHDMHAELIVGLARCGATIREEPITVLPRTSGESMYDLYGGLIYPARTLICLLGELLFYRRLKAALGPPAEIREMVAAPPRPKPVGQLGNHQRSAS